MLSDKIYARIHTMEISEIENQLKAIKEALLQVGEMRPGSLTEQYSVCGKKNCRCIDPKKPKKHGPYYQLSYVHAGKNTSRFIRPKFYQKIKQETEEYKKFKLLVDRWISISIQYSQNKMDLEKKREANQKSKKLKL